MFRGPSLLALCAIALTLGFLPARSAAMGDLRLAVPPRVKAGDVVTMDLPIAGPEVEEMEVLLSLDNGRTWPYRITQDRLEPGAVARWEVPNISCEAARVRLRYRVAGREREGPPGLPFVIVADLDRAPQRSLPRDEDAEHELDRGAGPRAETLESEHGPSMHLPCGESRAAPSDDDTDVAPRASARLRVSRSRAHDIPAIADSRTPEVFTPLRN